MKKIHIETLFAAFQTFQATNIKNMSNIREPKKWQEQLDKATEDFKKAIGPLAKHIDWSKVD